MTDFKLQGRGQRLSAIAPCALLGFSHRLEVSTAFRLHFHMVRALFIWPLTLLDYYFRSIHLLIELKSPSGHVLEALFPYGSRSEVYKIYNS